MKKIILVLSAIVVFISLWFGIVYFIIYYEPLNLDNLEEFYAIDDKYSYQFKLNKNTYDIAEIYMDNTDIIGIFIEKNNKYYLLAEVLGTYNDQRFYIKDDVVYINSANRPTYVTKILIDGTKVEKSEIKLDFSETSNTSIYNLQFNKVDNEYIYFHSYKEKNETNFDEGEDVKCSLTDKKCSYYNGYLPKREEITKDSRLVYTEELPNKEKSENYNKVTIYQNINNVIVEVSSDNENDTIQYDIKSNKKINFENVNIMWLYNDNNDEVKGVSIEIEDKDKCYSSRTISFKDKSIKIYNNFIIK